MRKKQLFGTRGIRGPIATKVTPELMLKLGGALADYIGRGKVVVGRDVRTSGEMLTCAFTAGLLSGGSDVIDIGIAPSPCIAFTVRALGASAGAVITASHNPPPDNGIAFYRSDGTEFLLEGELAIEEIVLGQGPKRASWDAIGHVQHHNAIAPYLAAIKRSVKVKRGLKVVVDCANGAGSLVTPQLLRELGCKVVTLNSHLDGHFPGRPSEPQPWNLGDLMRTVREVGADLGLAHDGDADRIAAVDERGNFVKHDALIALFAERAVMASKGGSVVTSVNTTAAIEEVVAGAGGKTFRTGLGNFTAAMLEHKACFAGEPGKLVFLEFGPWADGIFAAAKLIELVSADRKPLSKILAERVPDFPMYHEDFACPDERKAEFMRGMREYILKNVDEVRDVLDVDGVRVNRKNGSWILVRVSGTEPKARLVVEGRTKEELERLKKIGLEGVRRFLKSK
ncbi:MAG: phosphoglucosamine mutase [Hadesarchaea archaeon]|nr:phosphoglucosamine mutase [Hadesarchaea archaeon]